MDRSQWEMIEVRSSTVGPLIQGCHYLHRMPAVCVCCLGLYVGGWLKGALVWALPPLETAKRYGGVTWELARLWLGDELPHNSESWFIGRAIRHVRQQHPDVRWLVSYADPAQGHNGTIYKATNWTYEGMTEPKSGGRADYYFGTKRLGRIGDAPKGAVLTKRPRPPKHRYSFRLAGRDSLH